MIESVINGIRCGVCNKGKMYCCLETTFRDYSSPESFSLEDIDRITDGIINEYLVYKCVECGAIEKYTFKDIEKMIREYISGRVIDMMARDEIIGSLASKNKVYIYCGKCKGLDGKGSCLIKTYKKCKLKKFPDL